MLGTLNKTQIDNLLNGQMIGRVGCYANEKVYVVPITYAYDGDYIYGHTIEGMKILMMRRNPDICFQVDKIENMAHWRSAILWGKYEELESKDADDALQFFINRVQPLMSSETNRPKHGLDRKGIRNLKKTVVFRIKIEEIAGRYEKR
jgi:uncharacterized protein